VGSGLIGSGQSESIPPRSARQTLGAALSTLLVASAAPYGYTLTIWGSGALLIRSHGAPDVGEVFLFVAGAITGFNLLGLLVAETINRTMPIDRRADRLLAGVLDWIAVGAVIGAVSLLANIPGWVPWLVAPLVATALYLLLAGLQLAALAIRGHRSDDRVEPLEETVTDAQRAGDRGQRQVDGA
jgi:hypothetical protein